MSLAYITREGLDSSIFAVPTIISSDLTKSSTFCAFARVVAKVSQDASNISPRLSTILTPLSFLVKICETLHLIAS